jgi:hypothetical protein
LGIGCSFPQPADAVHRSAKHRTSLTPIVLCLYLDFTEPTGHAPPHVHRNRVVDDFSQERSVGIANLDGIP